MKGEGGRTYEGNRSVKGVAGGGGRRGGENTSGINEEVEGRCGSVINTYILIMQ